MTPPNAAKEVVARFWAAMHANDFAAAGALLTDDYRLEWPQSGETIVGRDNFVAVNARYPAAGPWRITIDRLVAEGDEVVSQVTVTDGAVIARAITFTTVRAGRLWRQTEYWPDPFPAPAWRAPWVENRGH